MLKPIIYTFLSLLLLTFSACSDGDGGRTTGLPSGGDAPLGGGDDDNTGGGGGGDIDYNDGTYDCNDDAPLQFRAIVRDFSKDSSSGAIVNPDFVTNLGFEASDKGLVNSTLTDGKPTLAKPNSITSSTVENFNQWYTTIPNVNMEFEKFIDLTQDPITGSWIYDTDRFFPLGNNEGYGTQGDADLGGVPQNFRFTTEFHMVFTYYEMQNFSFRGDDDVWVFINGSLVIDLGGIHSPEAGSINLDTLGLTPGEKYPMDIFHAERNPTGSNFRIETNIDCIKAIEID